MSVATVRALAAAITAISVVGIGLSLSMTLIALDLAEMHYDGTAIGAHAAVAGLAALVGAPFVPALATRIGAKRALVSALVLAAACLGLFAIFRNYWVWLGLRAIFSFALTILFVLSEYWINAITPPGRRGFVLGMYGMSLTAGFAAGPALLAAVGLADGRAFFLGIGLFIAAIGPIALGGPMPDVERQTKQRSHFDDFRAAPLPLLAALLHGALETAGLSLLAVFALQTGAPPSTGAWLVGLFAAGNVVFQVPVGLLSDRIDRTLLLLAIAVLSCAGAIALAALQVGTLPFALTLFVWGGLVGSFYAIGLAQIGSRFRGADLARVNATFIMFYALGMLIGPAFIGFALDLLPPHGFFDATALLTAAFAILAAATFRSRTRSVPQIR